MGKGDEPDWNDVRFFLVVARTKTLSGAARALGVRHTTVGRRLTALEEALGVSLVVRKTHSIELTATGEKLVPMAASLERNMGMLLSLVRSGRDHVRLALPSGLSTLFADRLGAFHAAHPDTTLELTSGSRPVDLQRGEADLALRTGVIADETLIGRKLCMVGWSLYASRRYLERRSPPDDPRRLAGHDIIGFHARLAGSPGAQWIDAHGGGATIVLSVAEMTEMLAAALSGAGLVVMPCVLAEDEPRMIRLTPEVLGSNPLSLAYRREVGNEDRVRAVIRFVASVIRDHAAFIGGDPAAARDNRS